MADHLTTTNKPWTPGPSILSTIQAWQGGEVCQLPDEEPRTIKIRFAPGAWDGIATHHMGCTNEHDEARHVLKTVEALARLVREDTDDARASLYRLFFESTVSPHFDALVEEIRRIKAQGVTMVWIEHVVHALLAVADRLFVINFGQKLAEGEPSTVMNDPEVRRVYMGLEV